MKIQPYIDRLNASAPYKEFHKKNSDAFMMAGFFVLDLELGKNMHQIDYYMPSKKKIAAFTIDKGVTMQLMEAINSKTPEKLDMKTQIDLDSIHGILEDEMKNRSITDDIKKIIAVIQTIEGKKVWNVNCVLSGMGILKAHIDDSSKTVLKMEKLSMYDLIKKMPASQLAQLQQAKANATGKDAGAKPSKKEATEQLDKLQKLEDQIEKEKASLKTQMSKEKSAKIVKKSK